LPCEQQLAVANGKEPDMKFCHEFDTWPYVEAFVFQRMARGRFAFKEIEKRMGQYLKMDRSVLLFLDEAFLRNGRKIVPRQIFKGGARRIQQLLLIMELELVDSSSTLFVDETDDNAMELSNVVALWLQSCDKGIMNHFEVGTRRRVDLEWLEKMTYGKVLDKWGGLSMVTYDGENPFFFCAEGQFVVDNICTVDDERMEQKDISPLVQLTSYLVKKELPNPLIAETHGSVSLFADGVGAIGSTKEEAAEMWLTELFHGEVNGFEPEVYSGWGESLKRHAYPFSVVGNRTLYVIVRGMKVSRIVLKQDIDKITKLLPTDADGLYRCGEHGQLVKVDEIRNYGYLIRGGYLPKIEKGLVFRVKINTFCKGIMCGTVRNLRLRISFQAFDGAVQDCVILATREEETGLVRRKSLLETILTTKKNVVRYDGKDSEVKKALKLSDGVLATYDQVSLWVVFWSFGQLFDAMYLIWTHQLLMRELFCTDSFDMVSAIGADVVSARFSPGKGGGVVTGEDSS